MNPEILEPFQIFSSSWDTWTPNQMLRAGAITLNAVGCAAMIPAAIILMHFTRRALRKIALSLLSFGAFGYLIGVLYGVFGIASPISTLLHVSMALTLWSMVPVIRERNRLRNRRSAGTGSEL